MYLPRPVSEVAVKRVENDVVVQFTVPTVNTDNSGPADLRRIEVYAHTGPLPAPADFIKYGTLVASVDIKQPPTPEELKEEEQRAKSQERWRRAKGSRLMPQARRHRPRSRPRPVVQTSSQARR